MLISPGSTLSKNHILNNYTIVKSQNLYVFDKLKFAYLVATLRPILSYLSMSRPIVYGGNFFPSQQTIRYFLPGLISNYNLANFSQKSYERGMKCYVSPLSSAFFSPIALRREFLNEVLGRRLLLVGSSANDGYSYDYFVPVGLLDDLERFFIPARGPDAIDRKQSMFFKAYLLSNFPYLGTFCPTDRFYDLHYRTRRLKRGLFTKQLHYILEKSNRICLSYSLIRALCQQGYLPIRHFGTKLFFLRTNVKLSRVYTLFNQLNDKTQLYKIFKSLVFEQVGEMRSVAADKKKSQLGQFDCSFETTGRPCTYNSYSTSASQTQISTNFQTCATAVAFTSWYSTSASQTQISTNFQTCATAVAFTSWYSTSASQTQLSTIYLT
jgi:hypothetical protein